jgi:hypothetical protein
MGCDAELGPLDVQITDHQTETTGSALDEIQALERLNSAALDQIDQTMFLLLSRTSKKVDTLLPLVLDYVVMMMQPLVDKIDTLHYSSRARVLKVAEDYAVRLLEPRYPRPAAELIARRIVNSYPEHGFVIDRDELSGEDFLGLVDFESTPPQVQSSIDEIEDFLGSQDGRGLLAVGSVVSVDDIDAESKKSEIEVVDAGVVASTEEVADG